MEIPEQLTLADTDTWRDQVVTINAYVVTSAGVTTVSDLLAESHPPQPGGRWLVVANPEALVLGETHSFETTEWTTSPVSITGRRVDDTFVVEPADPLEPESGPD